MPNTVEDNAMEFTINHLREKGFEVQNVSRGKRKNSEHKGYDLIAQRPGEAKITIEVKGCSILWGIPDPYETEFNEGRLVADFLYVVYLVPGSQPQLCAIPRDALKPEDVVPKSGYRISGRLKKKSVLEKFLQPL